MGRTAFLFPGQGSQRVGMGRDLYERSPLARELFERADAALGIPLARLCFEGPEAELTRTENAQPAIFTVSIAAWRLLEARGWRAERMAGHSLGEYSALTAAGAMCFEDGLRTVRRRGELMAEIGDRVRGGMAAILNLPVETVREICREAAGAGVVEVANENSPEQTVISGEAAALERAIALARDRAAATGARLRVVPLNVAAPFHCSLMAPLAEALAQVLAAVEIRPPRVPVVANVTAEYVTTPEAIREALVRQVAGRVRWTEAIRRLAADGVETVVEVGPGRVLTGLAARIEPSLRALDTAAALADPASS